ncbi:pyridoxamine 5'-phosphate oxidase family protein [Candidatus Poriferisodalis sp.]|uniref:pyridoxamine 5'-phosphate oxidase family protein n=1 Tax=Candidatus Poriferisodalis sp. TaxID=3101277 RepID=UPI003B0128FC
MSEPALDKLRRLVAAEHGLCSFVCLDHGGGPHVSIVNAGVMDSPASGETSVACVVRADARKVRLLRSDPRAAVAFRHRWDWVAVHGTAQLIGLDDPVSSVADADIPELLRDVFRAAAGTHEDWDEYDRVMAAQRRLAVFVSLDHVTSNAGSITGGYPGRVG